MNSGGLCNRVLKLMGNRFEFTVIATDKQSGEQAIDQAIEEVKRIEEILSTFRDSSQANKINRFAGIKPVKVDEEVLILTKVTAHFHLSISVIWPLQLPETTRNMS